MHNNLGKEIYNNKKSLKIFITNIGADYETPNFKASEYINNAYEALNYNKKYKINDFFDYNFINKNNNYNKKIMLKLIMKI